MEKMRQLLLKNFGTQDIFKIAAENNMYIVEENLGNQIAGYYNTIGEKLIHVNSEIPRYCKNIVIAYFLLNNTNKCTQTDGICFLMIKTLQKFKELPQIMNYNLHKLHNLAR